MRLGLRIATMTALSLAMFSGDLAKLSLSPAAAEARSYRNYGGHYGYRHGYRHRRGIDGGDVLAGALIIGGIAAIASAASNSERQRRESAYGRAEGYYDRPAAPGYRYDRYGYERAPAYDEGARRGERAGSNQLVDLCSRTAEREAQRGGGLARVVGISRVDELRDSVEVRGVVETTPDDDGYRNTERFVCTADYGRVVEFRFIG